MDYIVFTTANGSAMKSYFSFLYSLCFFPSYTTSLCPQGLWFQWVFQVQRLKSGHLSLFYPVIFPRWHWGCYHVCLILGALIVMMGNSYLFQVWTKITGLLFFIILWFRNIALSCHWMFNHVVDIRRNEYRSLQRKFKKKLVPRDCRLAILSKEFTSLPAVSHHTWAASPHTMAQGQFFPLPKRSKVP